jgi:hypothetical protein
MSISSIYSVVYSCLYILALRNKSYLFIFPCYLIKSAVSISSIYSVVYSESIYPSIA